MEKTREARRSATASMAASNGVTKRRQRFSENSRGDRVEKKERDPESLNRSKRRRSERFAPRECVEKEEDSSDESQGDEDYQLSNHRRKSFPSSRGLKHASSLKVDDEMIGVPVPRKARSACIKRSQDCRTSSGSGGGGFGASPGSYSVEVVSPSSSVKVSGSKSRIPKPPKSSGTVEDDLEIEIAEVLSGLKKQSHSSKREDDSEIKGVKKFKREGDESGGLIICKTRIEADHSARRNVTETMKASSDIEKEKETLDEKHRLDSSVSKGLREGLRLENNRYDNNCSRKLDIDLMVPPAMPSSPERGFLVPLVSDSIATRDDCKLDSSVKSKEQIIVKTEMTPEQVQQKTVDKPQWLNNDLERPSQETGRDSSPRLQNFDWNQPQQPKSGSAQQSSVFPVPVPVPVGDWPSGLSSQGYVPMIQTGKPVDGSNGSSTVVQGAPFPASQPKPKRCATHFFIARNIQLHQHFIKTNHLSQPNSANSGSFYIKSGDLKPAAGNPSLQGISPTLSLFSQTQDRVAVSDSALKDKASESGHVSSTNQKKLRPPPASSSIVPSPTFIFPTNHHLQPVMAPSKSPRLAKNPGVAVGSASVNFSHPSPSASEASTPYYTVLPNNAYSFQLPSTIRGGTPSQVLPFYNGSFYSPHMFQPSQLLQKQNQTQRETKASSCSSSSYRLTQPQVSANSLSSPANVQKHRQQSQKSEIKAAGDNNDLRGSHTQKGVSYGQIMTAPVQPQNISMSFANFTGASAPANLNFSSSGYHVVSAAPFGHQKNNQASDSKTGGGSCSSNVEEPKKTLPANGQTLVFGNPSRTLNFVSGTWPSPTVPTISGDPSMFTQRQQQQSGRSKTMTHSQADFVPASPAQWINLKQFQPHQQIRTHGLTQISFAAPSQSQTFQGQQGRSAGSSHSVTGSAQHSKASNSNVSNSKALPLSPITSSAAHAQEQTENSASGSTQKTSPVCGRTVPPIITSCPGHLSELKY